MEVAVIKDRIVWQSGIDDEGHEFGAKIYTKVTPQEIINALEMALIEAKNDLVELQSISN